jgi:SAM-dependent methyltransferase
MGNDDLLDAMRRDWDARARENPRHFIANCQEHWTDEDFRKSGEQTVAELILNDMVNVCQGRDPREMRVLEIGCGAGRVTRALAARFGEVHAVDVSGERVKLASAAVSDMPNAHVYQNNGKDLGVLGELTFHFAFSTCVFHHVPSKAVIESYIRDVGSRLLPGCLFKFEVQGHTAMKPPKNDTWLGVPMSEKEMLKIAERCGFEARFRVGAGEERFWLWFFQTDIRKRGVLERTFRLK